VAELLSAFSLETILIILIVCIPYIIKGIKAIYKFFQGLKERRQATLEEGRNLEREEQQTKSRFEKGENRITNLETKESELEAILKRQQELIDLLVISDELDIKAWIKAQHDKALLKKSLDSETRDLLE
jgi:predicted nuclease with TOPRIM domain